MAESLVSGAALCCEALLAAGVRTLFGIPGGAIMPFYHALPDYPELRHVLCRHEQGAGHAAQGYARASGEIGVCVATSGPGATNLVTPLADAWMDGTPLLALTGQVPSTLLGTDAFQETDIIGITLPIVKHSFLVTEPDGITPAVARAVEIAQSGRPGPVLIDFTKDAQQGRTTRNRVRTVGRPARSPARGPEGALERAAAALSCASRPVILAGHGVLQAGASDALRELAEWLDIPFTTTLLGLGALPDDHELSLGMAGMHGEVRANRALQHGDVLLAVGARFDDRVTGRVDRFAPNATVIHLDVEPAQIGKLVGAAVELAGSAGTLLPALRRLVPRRTHPEWRDWLARFDAGRRRTPEGTLGRPGTGFPPDAVYRALDGHLAGRTDVRIVTDVGQHQMWAAQRLGWRRPGAHLTSGGAGTMGFAIPAALGAALARPEETIWVIVGDGGFQMTNQELATMVQEGIRNVKVAIVNNGYLGMVRQWQQLFHGRRYSGTPLSGPDFAALARAYGVHALTVHRPEDAASAIAQAALRPETVVIDFQVEREANVFPIVPPGHGIDQPIERVKLAR